MDRQLGVYARRRLPAFITFAWVCSDTTLRSDLVMLLCCSHMCLDCREEHGPHVWIGNLELATPTAAFGKSSNHLLLAQQQGPKVQDAGQLVHESPSQMQIAE